MVKILFLMVNKQLNKLTVIILWVFLIYSFHFKDLSYAALFKIDSLGGWDTLLYEMVNDSIKYNRILSRTNKGNHLDALNQIEGLSLKLYGLPSPYWGQDQVVTGLLTGADLLSGLKGKELGNDLLIPSVMLKQNKPIFLDDMTVEELSNALGVQIRIVDGADEIVSAAMGHLAKII